MTKKVWSRPTWFFFHGIAQQINKKFYDNNYIEVWTNIIKNICYNLPCPMCKYHAINYISLVKHRDINTKERLIRYLFNFHNNVNSRIGKPIFNFSNLEKYKRLKIIRTFNVMYKNLTRNYYSGNTFTSWDRRKKLEITLTYMKEIINYLE